MKIERNSPRLRVIQRDSFHGLGWDGDDKLSWAACALEQGKLRSEFKGIVQLKNSKSHILESNEVLVISCDTYVSFPRTGKIAILCPF